MLIDARTLDDSVQIDADICIVGSGAAGLTLANALIGSGRKVVLLEAGGLELDADDQHLYHGRLVGLPYFPLNSSRLRYFGGTTNHWSGYCIPYQEKALEPRPGVPHSGWPITETEINPYVSSAARLIGLPEARWDMDQWSKELDAPYLPLRPGAFNHVGFLIRPMRFAQELGPQVRADPSTDIYLHANVVDIRTDASARTVIGLTARTREGNSTLQVSARRYVLAAGGIENPRLLLVSNKVEPNGLGNRHDLVGRFFADHVVFESGVLKPSDPGIDISFYLRHRLDGFDLYSRLRLPVAKVAERGLLPASLALIPKYDPVWTSGGAESAKEISRAVRRLDMPSGLGRHLGNIAGDFFDILGLGWRSLRNGGVPIEEIRLRSSLAPAPNPDSRVLLDDEVDELGLRRVKLDWRLLPIDKHSARFAAETFAVEAGAAGIGRVQVLLDDSDDYSRTHVEPTYHHLCTTRMADDASQGVVDRNCRVHGVDNLYCAGSSVFSTPGDGTPTMMIVALALRLADHLKEISR